MESRASQSFLRRSRTKTSRARQGPGQRRAGESIEDLGRPLDHANDRQQGTQGGDDGRHAEPAVHEQVAGLGPGGQDATEHGREQFGGLGGGLPASERAAAAAVQGLGHALVAVARVGRRQEREVQGDEAHTVGPGQGQHAETPEEAALAVVEDPGEEFDLLCPGPFDGGVVENEHGLPVVAGQGVEHGHGPNRQTKKEPPPAVAAGGEEVVDGVLAQVGTGIRHHGPENILAKERQGEQGDKQPCRRNALLFRYPAAIGKSRYVEPFEKQGYLAGCMGMIFLQDLESYRILHVGISFFCFCCVATTVYKERKCPSS